MGVPGFFAWLLRKCKVTDIIKNELNETVDILYIDANCLFHPQCFKVLNFYSNDINVDKLIDKMIKRILNYIDYLITYVNPRLEVFISVDGVAPMAKMNQQRKRRFKTMQENDIRNNLKKKYNKDISTIWSNTCITPGTKFMELLHQKIINHIQLNKIGLKINYTYSSYHVIGEGEHKILQDIKKRTNQDLVYVIYGLDADLLFLSMASKKNNIYLLREETILRSVNHVDKEDIIDITKDVAEDLNFVSIEEFKKNVNNQIKNIINKQLGDNIDDLLIDNDFVDDFIIICFFLGNDFVPNIPSIDIKTEGLDFILKNYADTFLTLNCQLSKIDENNLEINEIFLELFLENLASGEEYYFKFRYPKYKEYIGKRKCMSEDPYEKELWDMENMKTAEINDPIGLGTDSHELWKFRYYEYYYGISHNQTDLINNICSEYLTGIMWIIKYYFRECPSWSWQYTFYHAPFITDLVNFVKINKYNINKVKFVDNIIPSPLTQLMSVLPPSCSDLLPLKFAQLMTSPDSPIIDMFPIDVKVDTLYKDSLHKCIPFVPNINLKRINSAVKDIKLNDDEIIRNKITENYSIIYKK